MTKTQASKIALAIKDIRETYSGSVISFEGGMEFHFLTTIDTLAIRIANELNTYSKVFNRNEFLRECGLPDYQHD